MYTLEERLLAIKTYYAMGKSYKATLQQLGYPDKTNLYRWLKEYERDHSRHDHRARWSKFTEDEIQAAIDSYYAHGQNYLQTVKAG